MEQEFQIRIECMEWMGAPSFSFHFADTPKIHFLITMGMLESAYFFNEDCLRSIVSGTLERHYLRRIIVRRMHSQSARSNGPSRTSVFTTTRK